MHYAAVAGQEGAIATLLDAGADVNSVDEHGATPLHLASEMGFTYCISALIAAEAEVNSHNHVRINYFYILVDFPCLKERKLSP